MTAQNTDSKGRVGPAAIARYWAEHGIKVSRQAVDKAIRKAGCPTHSLEAALAWRTARTGKPPKEGKGGGGAAEDIPRGEMPAEISGNSLDDGLARARQTEMEQYRIWREAVADKDPAAQERALKNHATAQKNVSDIEEKIFAVRKDRGEYVLLPEAQVRIDARLSQFRAAMTSFPRILALDLTPADAQRNEARIKTLQAAHFNKPLAAAEKPLVDTSPSAVTSPVASVDTAPSAVASSSAPAAPLSAAAAPAIELPGLDADSLAPPAPSASAPALAAPASASVA